jgi:hypothetical protein
MPFTPPEEERTVHFLTKVFVVVAAVLAILLSALTISVATNAKRISDDFNSERTKYAALEGAASSSTAQSKQESVRLNAMAQQLQNQLSELQGQISSLQAERSQLLVERDRAVSDRATTESKIGELGELAKTQAQLITVYRDEATTLRKNELTFRQRSLEMEDRLSDVESQRDVLEQNYRALQEEITQIRRDASTTVSAGATSGEARPFTFAGPIISGRVESVQRDPASGKTLAKLSIGSNDRVAKNMQLRVIRSGEFIANVVVETTDLSFSIGAVDTLGRKVEVREGDSVVSRIQ